MPDYKIKLRNIKNIGSLEMNYPQRPGVYLLSGCNGCGKSTLLVSLHRLGDRNSFSNNFSPTPLYSYQNAEIEYSIDEDSVVYKKKEIRWPPHPKNKSGLIDRFPPSRSILITASGIRFFTQQGNVAGARMEDAPDFIKDSMNHVFNTTEFSNLKYKQIKPKRGKLRNLPRPYKLYIMSIGRKKYDENNFSLGERLVLNTLELISNADPQSQILIDEVELALHPVAQANFYRLLERLAQERSLFIFVSTHSATLVKLSKKNFHLKPRENGRVEVIPDSYPAYILSDIGIDANYQPDKIFFVEDDMAAEYLRNIISKVIVSMDLNPTYIVIPIGGYPQVVEFLRNYRMIVPDENKTHAMLDEDVRAAYTGLRRNSPHDQLVEKFQDEINHGHLDYLDITPEIGLWEWISENPENLKNEISERLGISLGGWNVVVDIHEIESLPQSPNPRKTAKTRMNKLMEKLRARMPNFTEDEIMKSIIKIYVERKSSDDDWMALQMRKISPFLRS